MAVGVGESIEMSELEGIATDPDESNVYVVRDFYALSRIMVDLLGGICNSKPKFGEHNYRISSVRTHIMSRVLISGIRMPM